MHLIFETHVAVSTSLGLDLKIGQPVQNVSYYLRFFAAGGLQFAPQYRSEIVVGTLQGAGGAVVGENNGGGIVGKMTDSDISLGILPSFLQGQKTGSEAAGGDAKWDSVLKLGSYGIRNRMAYMLGWPHSRYIMEPLSGSSGF